MNEPSREEEKKPEDSDQSNGIGGPVVIPAAAAFVGAVLGAVIGSQI